MGFRVFKEIVYVFTDEAGPFGTASSFFQTKQYSIFFASRL